MNVTFENALSIANNVGGEDYALQELPYDVLREQLENSRFKMAKQL